MDLSAYIKTDQPATYLGKISVFLYRAECKKLEKQAATS